MPNTPITPPNSDSAVLYTLAYFDIFDHPLTLEEVQRFCPLAISEDEVMTSLGDLMSRSVIYRDRDMYSLHANTEHVTNRLLHNRNAEKIMPIAEEKASLIRSFPFVEGACISGGLSKGVFKEDDDIDFFIVTSKNRVWISKLLLKIYKVLWLRNSRKYFCVNYFISEEDLEIKEKNLYTATELVTLLPMMGENAYQKLKEKNSWVLDFLPNSEWERIMKYNSSKPIYSKVIEGLMYGPIGNGFDLAIMHLMNWRNRRKYKHLQDNSNFDLMFKSTRTESKIHPLNMSYTVQERHKQRLADYYNR